jgi:CubicO group peptidase (beta-lactamase class C family)/outer membrane lipoprotein-sorting protein
MILKIHTWLAGFLTLLSVSLYSQYQQLDQQIPKMMQDAGVPGLSIAVINSGKVAYSNAFGLRSNDGSATVDPSTVFAAASLSKPLFAFAVMQLVEEGRFDLDRPLANYFDYEDLRHAPRYRSITARMVLSHTSGLPNWRNGRLEFINDPGESFQYSGEGFVFLQKVIENITGLSVEQLLQQKVLKPLEMNSSSYLWQNSFESDFAIPHDELGFTHSKYKPNEANTAHSLQTTATDYAKFVIAMLNGIVLRKATADSMITAQSRPVSKYFGTAEKNIAWGLGWGIQETEQGNAFWHWGDNGTFKCFALAFPKDKSGIVFFTNSSNGLSFVDELVKIVFQSPCPACRWIDYPRSDQPSFHILKNIVYKGFDIAMNPFLVPTGTHQNITLIPEQAMNNLGYSLLRYKRIEDAKRIFKMNTVAFPGSSNTFDSYAEACLRNGEQSLARENYEKAFSMDANNKTAESIAMHLSGMARGNTTFRLDGYSNARLVTLAGDFNGWNELSIPLRRKDGVWTGIVELTPGTHHYKFIVDGVWIPDPANPVVSKDGFHNSVIEIKLTRSPSAATPIVSPADEVLNKYAEAIGGKAKWKELKNYVMTMRNTQGAGNSNMTMTMKKPNKFRIDFDNPPNRMTKAFNGTKGVVSINYRNQDMSEGEQKEMAEEPDFYDELLFAKERGYATSLLENEEINGKKVFKIKLTKDKNDDQLYYLDSETYLPVMVAEYSQDINFNGVLFKTMMSDYRDVDGLKFPFKVTLLANDRVMWNREVESLKLNTKVDDKLFEVK